MKQEIMKNNRNSLRVGREYRINPLSFQEGGHEVLVVFEDGLNLEYDNIHNPKAYVRRISKDIIHGKVEEVYVDGKLLEELQY
tara:strand:- start:3977 stop:4225 length:249 start_codon:yes stop_codon:yes gene_type:complete